MFSGYGLVDLCRYMFSGHRRVASCCVDVLLSQSLPLVLLVLHCDWVMCHFVLCYYALTRVGCQYAPCVMVGALAACSPWQ